MDSRRTAVHRPQADVLAGALEVDDEPDDVLVEDVLEEELDDVLESLLEEDDDVLLDDVLLDDLESRESVR